MDFEKFDVIILSDYNKGVVNKIEKNNIITIVDPKKEDFSESSIYICQKPQNFMWIWLFG